MSLDVYLTLPGVPAVQSAGIFIRRDGGTVELSRDEWDALYPGREPVTMLAQAVEDTEVYWANITHNLGRMAGECGLYKPLWRPDEEGFTTAAQLIEPLREGLAVLRFDRERLIAFNPENGWGDYDGLLRFTEGYLAACEEHPEAEIRVSR